MEKWNNEKNDLIQEELGTKSYGESIVLLWGQFVLCVIILILWCIWIFTPFGINNSALIEKAIYQICLIILQGFSVLLSKIHYFKINICVSCYSAIAICDSLAISTNADVIHTACPIAYFLLFLFAVYVYCMVIKEYRGRLKEKRSEKRK